MTPRESPKACGRGTRVLWTATAPINPAATKFVVAEVQYRSDHEDFRETRYSVRTAAEAIENFTVSALP